MNLALQLLILLSATNSVFGIKKNKFAIMEVVSRTGTVDVCVNVQQYNGKPTEMPDEEAGQPFRLVWWDLDPGLTTICTSPRAPYRFSASELVPLNYFTRPSELSQACRFQGQHFDRPINYQLGIARSAGVQSFLFLVDRNAINVNGTHDYLHSEFCNPETEETTAYGYHQQNGSIFFVYKHNFEQFVLPKLRDSASPPDSVRLRFSSPAVPVLDLALLLLWALILLTALLAGIWTAGVAKEQGAQTAGRGAPNRRQGRDAEQGVELTEKRQKSAEDTAGGQQEEVPAAEEQTAEEDGQPKAGMSWGQTLCWVIVVIIGVVVLITAFHRFFGLFLSIVWTILGITCVSHALFAICKYIIFPDQRGKQRVLISYKNLHLTPMGILCYGVALLVCVPWFLFRYHPLAFLLLDLMNIAICAWFIKLISYRRYAKEVAPLKQQLYMTLFYFAIGLLGLVLMILFPSDNAHCHPTAPVEEDNIMVGAFFVPLLRDPLSVCWDVDVELGYRHLFVTLLPIILSAYSLPYWFFIDFVNNYKKFTYGFVALGGYALFLLPLLILSVFLQLDQVRHLTILFLLLAPVPVLFGSIFAKIQGTFDKLWKGQLVLNNA